MSLYFIAGPCAVESEEQVMSIAEKLNKLGIQYFRGGAFKPRTSPSSFQGLEYEGLKLLQKVKEKFNMKIVTEVLCSEDINSVSEVADVLQIGTRNMYNYSLLKKIAKKAPNKTVLLKRGFSATKKELLGSIQYLKDYGHKSDIIICERGIRTFTNGVYDRFTLDLALIADLKKDDSFSYNVIVDPSHAAGRSDIVSDLAYAGVAAGADALMIEVKLSEQCNPKCDANQAITIKELEKIINISKKISDFVSK